ncbi:MAG: glutamate-1-semialdehyde 2,1-aminomutase [Chloroflexi bacterium]|nr:glutamate-1-semialdehyde 2,1-aminomutase [Chloroflexota bacterium]
MNTQKSRALFTEAQRYIPGGVDSPVRAFGAVGGQPLFIQRGRGSHIWDADGNEYIDYVGSWGPLILGHAHPQVVAALKSAAEAGTSFGAPTELEIELARLVTAAMPSVEMVRFVSSGTEATMSALRLARAFTGRDKVVKFAGCYHGHSDGLLAKAGSGLATLGLPASPGVPASYAQNTLVLPYNDIEAVSSLLQAQGQHIAAIIVEPVAGNMGVVLPRPGFLEGLRQITRDAGALLIFDEVITGFRLAYGGSQAVYNVVPDLTCLGKIIGGGLPVGAYGGRRDIMQMVAPLGPVYQAGTLSGNPLAMTAGVQTLSLLARPQTYQALEEKAQRLAQGLRLAAQDCGVDLLVSRAGSMLTAFFTSGEVVDYDTALTANTQRYARFFQAMLERGVYLPCSQFEAMFLSSAHSDSDVASTIEAARQALASLRR